MNIEWFSGRFDVDALKRSLFCIRAAMAGGCSFHFVSFRKRKQKQEKLRIGADLFEVRVFLVSQGNDKETKAD